MVIVSRALFEHSLNLGSPDRYPNLGCVAVCQLPLSTEMESGLVAALTEDLA